MLQSFSKTTYCPFKDQGSNRWVWAECNNKKNILTCCGIWLCSWDYEFWLYLSRLWVSGSSVKWNLVHKHQCVFPEKIVPILMDHLAQTKSCNFSCSSSQCKIKLMLVFFLLFCLKQQSWKFSLLYFNLITVLLLCCFNASTFGCA